MMAPLSFVVPVRRTVNPASATIVNVISYTDVSAVRRRHFTKLTFLISYLDKYFGCPPAVPCGHQPILCHPRVWHRGHVETSEAVRTYTRDAKLSWQRQHITANRWRPCVLALYLSACACVPMAAEYVLYYWNTTYIGCIYTFMYIETQRSLKAYFTLNLQLETMATHCWLHGSDKISIFPQYISLIVAVSFYFQCLQ